MTELGVSITPLVIESSETIVSKNTPKKIAMTKLANELIVSKYTKKSMQIRKLLQKTHKK